MGSSLQQRNFSKINPLWYARVYVMFKFESCDRCERIHGAVQHSLKKSSTSAPIRVLGRIGSAYDVENFGYRVQIAGPEFPNWTARISRLLSLWAYTECVNNHRQKQMY